MGSWLQKHLEEFVKPVLGYIPTLPNDYKSYFTSVEKTVIKNIWRAFKNEALRLNKPILLAGRDVFVWEILARREGFPTVFRPDISTLTVNHIKEDYSNYCLLDTGYSGSVPKSLKCAHFLLGASNNVPGPSTYPPTIRGDFLKNLITPLHVIQVFPRMRDARSLMTKIEMSPKYWERGFYRDPMLELLKELVKGSRCVDVSTVRNTTPVANNAVADPVDALFHPVEDGPQPIFLDPALICGGRSIKVAHGYLCGKHYREQAMSMPQATPKPQPQYQDAILPGMVDCALIAEKEAKKISVAHKRGNVRRVRFGALEPDYLHFVPHVFDEDYVW